MQTDESRQGTNRSETLISCGNPATVSFFQVSEKRPGAGWRYILHKKSLEPSPGVIDEAYLEVTSFSLLRNVSIRMRQGSPDLCRRLAAQLGGVLGGIEAQTSSMAVGLLLVANIINLGADLGAMAAALQLLVGGPMGLYVVGFAVGSALLEVFVSYERYVAILKWTSFVLLTYVAVAIAIAELV